MAIGEYGFAALKKLIDLAPKEIYTNDQHHCHTLSGTEDPREYSRLSFHFYNTYYKSDSNRHSNLFVL